MRINIEPEDFGTLCICAIRYCHGRETYMPSMVRRIVSGYLDKVTDKTLNVMINDCEYQKTYSLYGDISIDKPGWLQWKERLLQEQKDRETKDGKK